MTSFKVTNTNPSTAQSEMEQDLFAEFPMDDALTSSQDLPDLEADEVVSENDDRRLTEAIAAVEQELQHETDQAAIALETIRTVLQTQGLFTQPELQRGVDQLSQLISGVHQGFKGHLADVVQQKFEQSRQYVQQVGQRLRQTHDMTQLFQIATAAVRQFLEVDRAVIYRFEGGDRGTVLMESVAKGWTPMMSAKTIVPLCFGEDTCSAYLKRSAIVLQNLDKLSITPYQSQLVEQYQIKASLAIPIWVGSVGWGLLVAQHCRAPRQWQEVDIAFLTQLATEISPILQNQIFIQRQQQWVAQGNVLAKIVNQIYQSPDANSVFRIATEEVRRQINCDRVAIYRFNPDWTGEFIAESVGSGWKPLMQEQYDNPALRQNINECSVKDLARNNPRVADTYLRENNGGRFSQGEPYRICNDVYSSGFTQCYIQMLERYQAKAYVMVAIYEGDRLWGLMAVYQCSGPRQWSEAEVEMLAQVGTNLNIALQQSNKTEELTLAIQREKAISEIINRILRSSDLTSILQNTTRELRQLFQCDRVVVYKFYPDWSGEIVAETVVSGWKSLLQEQNTDNTIRTSLMASDDCVVKAYGNPSNLDPDTYLKETKGGMYSKGTQFLQVDDIYEAGFSPCYLETLENRFQARAYINTPIFNQGQLWGLIAVYQCSEPRAWKENETKTLVEIAQPLGLALQQAENTKQLNQTVKREQTISKVISRLLKTTDLKSILRDTTQELRQLLQSDRVVVYKFYPDWSGEIVAESVMSGWKSLLQEQENDAAIKTSLMAADDCVVKTFGSPANRDPDTYLKETQGGIYSRGTEYRQVDDIYEAGFSACYLETLEERFQARAYINAPIFNGNQLWGLVAVYQCSGSRAWTTDDTKLVVEIARPLGLAIQQAERNQSIQDSSAREAALSKVVPRILKAEDERTIFRIATQELRTLLKCDRVGIYRFTPDWSGEFVAESVSGDWVPLVGPDIKTVWEDTHLQETKGGRYKSQETFVVNDIYAVGHSQCHIEILEQFQVKAYMIAPIFYQDKLWGLLGAYQNSDVREWKPEDEQVLAQIGVQIGVALQQIAYLKEVQDKTNATTEIADRTIAYNKLTYRVAQRIISQIQESDTADPVFRLVTQELRRQLKSDRVAIYKFNLDWSGEFIFEDVGGDYPRLVGSDRAVVRDTFLQETQGGRYKDGESFRVENIYTVGHSDCHVELLESWAAKAYMLAPVFTGDKLWGIIGAYQNDGPRPWQDYEVELLGQLGVLIGISVQQEISETKLRNQATEIAETAARNKSERDNLQQQIIQMLTAVRPALNGDLTVRAPVTEDAVGTVADAYNNTIQSLRQLVAQVKTATTQVSSTSQENGEAIALLSEQTQIELEQITQALNQVQSMMDAAQLVAGNAQQVEIAVQQANQTVQQGDNTMNQTVEGILTIRETVSEAAKKIKRLSESSQKISKVVNLIGNFTTQTQLLALNAAIEATRAGEYGRGFAVVADEVRSLAQQSSEATSEIEKLVQEIQAETSAVSTAMDAGIQQVVEGTGLVSQTRQSLNEIVAATAQISQLIQGITSSTQAQIHQSETVTKTMNDVAAIAQKTSADSTQIASSFQTLLATAETLQASVGQFKVD